jgi:hypothetical protein
MFSPANQISLAGMIVANYGMFSWVTQKITNKTYCIFNIIAGMLFGISAFVGGIWVMSIAEVFSLDLLSMASTILQRKYNQS